MRLQAQFLGLVDTAENERQRTGIVGHVRLLHLVVDAHHVVRPAASVSMHNLQTVAVFRIHQPLHGHGRMASLRIAHVQQPVFIVIPHPSQQPLGSQQSVYGSLCRDVGVQIGLRLVFGDAEAVVVHGHHDILMREADGCLGIQVVVVRRASVLQRRRGMVVDDEAVGMVLLRKDGIAHHDGARKRGGRNSVGAYRRIYIIQAHQSHVHHRAMDNGRINNGFLGINRRECR